MSFELPHENDFATNAKLPGYLTENALAIEQAINDLNEKMNNEVQDRESEDNELSDQISSLKGNSATHDEVKQQINELQQRINHLYAGDPQAIKAVVTEILEDKGAI